MLVNVNPAALLAIAALLTVGVTAATAFFSARYRRHSDFRIAQTTDATNAITGLDKLVQGLQGQIDVERKIREDMRVMMSERIATLEARVVLVTQERDRLLESLDTATKTAAAVAITTAKRVEEVRGQE